MTRISRRFIEEEHGATLAVTAVMVVSLLSVIALAFDLGLLFVARSEAQRGADSSALAGASAFVDLSQSLFVVDSAIARAKDYATKNDIRNLQIDTAEVTVTVDPALRRVHVFIRRTGIPMWFARLFGVNDAPVAASAMAHASQGNEVDCIAPIAMPDWWNDTNNDTNGNRLPDIGETWVFTPGTDVYEAFNNNATATETGLGSVWRDNSGSPLYSGDNGRIMVIKEQPNSGNALNMQPGWWQALDFDFSGYGPKGWWGAMEDAAKGICPWGGSAIGDSIDTQNGHGVGPTRKAFQDIFDLDDNAYWDPLQRAVIDPDGVYGPNESPRVLTFALFNPDQIGSIQGKSKVVPTNFVLFFVENRPLASQDDVTGRFLKYVTGTGPGTPGSLVYRVQLIQ